MGPLAGLRILELGGIGPGPMAAMLLADMGATVIRVDRVVAGEAAFPVDARFDVVLRNRRSLGLDIRKPQGLALLLKLVDASDGLIEGFRPGVAERLGFGPEVCMGRNPKLVYGRMTGFGQDGPLAHTAGHDLNYIALTGALHAVGRAGERPVPPLNLVGDYGGGAMFLAFGMVCALFERSRSGRGQVVDSAMVDGASMLMAPFFGWAAAGQWTQARGTNLLDGGAPFYDSYETADGKYVAFAAIEGKFFATFAEAAGLDRKFVAGQNDRSLWPEMRSALRTLFKSKSRAEWCAQLEASDACLSGVLSIEEVPHHPHNRARGSFIELDGVTQPAPAPRFSRSTPETPKPPQSPGCETDAILMELGLDSNDIEVLRANGVIGKES